MAEKSLAQVSFFSPELVDPRCLVPGSVPWMLARFGSRLFPAWLLEGWCKVTGRGRDAWPAVTLSQNWRGKLLVSHEVIVNLIAAMRTRTGLKVRARLDKRRFADGVKISDKQRKTLALVREEVHGEWNYLIEPRH